MDNQPNNPLHGVKLADIVTKLQEKLGWDGLAAQIDVRCFQNGKKIIDAKDLRLRKIKGNLTVGKEFVDQSGRQVVLFISRDTSCLVQETKPKPFMGLPMADPKSK